MLRDESFDFMHWIHSIALSSNVVILSFMVLKYKNFNLFLVTQPFSHTGIQTQFNSFNSLLSLYSLLVILYIIKYALLKHITLLKKSTKISYQLCR